MKLRLVTDFKTGSPLFPQMTCFWVIDGFKKQWNMILSIQRGVKSDMRDDNFIIIVK